MEINDLKIIPPEGMECYIDGNEIKFKPVENIKYEQIAESLFKDLKSWYVGNYGSITPWFATTKADTYYSNLGTSIKQMKKLLAINQLMNVAKYLNDNWKPDWSDRFKYKYYIFVDHNGNISVSFYTNCNASPVYFKTRELAEKAIKILGEETIKLALSTDW